MGPGPASGWYCTVEAGTSSSVSPSTVPPGLRDSPPSALAVDLLQRQHLRLARARRGDRPRGGVAAGQRRDARDPARRRGAADLPAVGARARARRRVDDEVDLAGLDALGDVRRPLADLLQHGVDAHAHAADRLRRAGRRDDAEAEVAEQRRDPRRRRLVAVGHRDEDRPGLRQLSRRPRPAPSRTPSGSRARCP